jgi:hypothetical protein
VTAPPASPRRWRGGPLRRPATRFPGGVDGPRRESRTRECGGGTFWSAQADRRPEAFVPIEIGPSRRLRAGRRPSPTRSVLFRSAQADRRPEAFVPIEIGPSRRLRAGRRPSPMRSVLFRSAQADRRPEALCRLKSAFQGAARQASAFADAKNAFRSAQADRWPEAFVPIEIGLPRRCAPGVGLRRR